MLRLGNIRIKDAKFGKETKIKDGILYIKKKEFLEAAKADDKRIASIRAHIALPGDSVRIIPIKDVIEPRVEINDSLTLALRGISVITCGQIVGFQEGLLDMSELGAEYSSFSKLTNIVLVVKAAKGITQHQHEEAIRLLGLRAADYLAKTAEKISQEETEFEEFPELLPHEDNATGLPKIVYVYMLLSQGLMHDTYVYGKDAKTERFLPVIIQPKEIIKGAIISGNCVSACDKNTTYHHQNNPVIRELYKKHGKELNFVGIILTNESTKLAEKQWSAGQVIQFAERLAAQGAVISKEGFGNPDADLMMICSGLKEKGIKTICITDEFAGSDGASQSLADTSPAADAVVSTGNANEIITLPPMKKTIGDLKLLKNLAGGYPKSLKEDGSIEIELQAILGATNQLGYEKLSARER